jgi:hypothetical protein
MMSIVMALLGAMFCGAALTPLIGGSGWGGWSGWLDASQAGLFGVAPLWNVLFGAVLTICALIMIPAFGRSEKRLSGATIALIISSVTAVFGIVAVALVYRNPFSWMTAVTSLAIFIDAVCLKISLAHE